GTWSSSISSTGDCSSRNDSENRGGAKLILCGSWFAGGVFRKSKVPSGVGGEPRITLRC
nr:hypothetical protein [Tanacetum cinerariifolium]